MDLLGADAGLCMTWIAEIRKVISLSPLSFCNVSWALWMKPKLSHFVLQRFTRKELWPQYLNCSRAGKRVSLTSIV